MKQIFDWLREQMEWNQTVEMYFDGTPPKQYVEREKWVAVINEAEAKWEAENTYRCNGNYNDNYKNALKVCPYCGKRIKILEVE